MRKYVFAVVFAAVGALGCGESSLGGYPSVGCDVPSPDVSASSDVPIVEAAVDASVSDVVVPMSPYRLNVQFFAPMNQRRVEQVRMIWFYPGRLGLETMFEPTLVPMMGGEYAPISTQIEVQAEELIANIYWQWHPSADDPAGTASMSLFYIEAIGPEMGSYRFSGQVTVTDQFGRRWLGYPTVVNNGRGNFLRFVPGERCAPGYASRRDGICLI